MKRPHKYGAIKTTVDGIVFDSRAEARRYSELRLLVRAGEIEGLRLQPVYPITFNGLPICKYVGDFAYTDMTTGDEVVEDVKGVKTPAYRIKAKLMKAQYGITIYETGARK